RRRGPHGALASVPRRPRLRVRALAQSSPQLVPPAPRARLLVAVGLSQIPRQTGGCLHRCLRRGGFQRNPAPGPRRGDLRPHSPPLPSRPPPHPLTQLLLLGG